VEEEERDTIRSYWQVLVSVKKTTADCVGGGGIIIVVGDVVG
jgi:hypothetical protein